MESEWYDLDPDAIQQFGLVAEQVGKMSEAVIRLLMLTFFLT